MRRHVGISVKCPECQENSVLVWRSGIGSYKDVFRCCRNFTRSESIAAEKTRDEPIVVACPVSDTFQTTRYKGYWIHTHFERERGSLFGREVVKVQDPETLASIEVRSFRAAQLYITRRVKCQEK